MKIDPRTKLFLVVAANSLILTAPFAYSALMVAVPAILLLFERKWRFVLTFFSAYLAAAIGFDYLKKAHDIQVDSMGAQKEDVMEMLKDAMRAGNN